MIFLLNICYIINYLNNFKKTGGRKMSAKTAVIMFIVFIISTVMFTNNAISQIVWDKYEDNPVLTEGAPGAWDENFIHRSSVVFDGTAFRMWYVGLDHNDYYSIGYAYSTDGINWTKYAGNPVLSASGVDSWDKDAVDFACVLHDGTIFHMWYTGYNNSIAETSVGYATSTNGIDWQKYAGNPVLSPSPQSWEESIVRWPKVIKIESTYHLWYTGGTKNATGYATSQDGITWNKHEGNPVISLGHDLMPCQIIFQDKFFKMWYVRLTYSGTDIELAISTDGINWTMSAANPVLEHGKQGTWDEFRISDCAIITDDTTFKMWYSGNDSYLNSGIGYATSTPKTHDVKVTSIYDSLTAVPICCYMNFVPKAKLMNIGLSDENNVTVNCLIDSAGREIYFDTQTIESFEKSIVESKEIMFEPFSYKTSEPFCYNIKYYSSLISDQYVKNDTIASTIYVSNRIDDFELGLYLWTPDSCWVITHSSASSGLASLRNTSKSFYDNNLNSCIEFNLPFDLSQLEVAHVSFWTKHYIETEKDFGYIEVSTDGGQNWIQLGDAFTGVQASWKEDFRSLNDFCGTGCDDVKLRFHFVSDSVAGHPALGWFIDDVEIYPTSAPITAVNPEINENVPELYTLSDNYPNPFNNHTAIN